MKFDDVDSLFYRSSNSAGVMRDDDGENSSVISAVLSFGNVLLYNPHLVLTHSTAVSWHSLRSPDRDTASRRRPDIHPARADDWHRSARSCCTSISRSKSAWSTASRRARNCRKATLRKALPVVANDALSALTLQLALSLKENCGRCPALGRCLPVRQEALRDGPRRLGPGVANSPSACQGWPSS